HEPESEAEDDERQLADRRGEEEEVDVDLLVVQEDEQQRVEADCGQPDQCPRSALLLGRRGRLPFHGSILSGGVTHGNLRLRARYEARLAWWHERARGGCPKRRARRLGEERAESLLSEEAVVAGRVGASRHRRRPPLADRVAFSSAPAAATRGVT